MTEKKIQGEAKALKLLADIEKSLGVKEQIILFFFFTCHGSLFHTPFRQIPELTGDRNQDFELLLTENRAKIRNILDIEFNEIEFQSAEKEIRNMWSKHIKENCGVCSSYFAAITVYKLKNYFSTKEVYAEIKKEAKILIDDACITERHIDLIGYEENVLYDLCESKHTVHSQKEKLCSEIEYLCFVKKILEPHGFESNCFLGTLDFIKKNKIKIMVNRLLESENIVNGEDIFSCKIS